MNFHGFIYFFEGNEGDDLHNFRTVLVLHNSIKKEMTMNMDAVKLKHELNVCSLLLSKIKFDIYVTTYSKFLL